MGLLDRAGARLTSRTEEADILVVNTCSFIDTAKQESVDTILEMARHKTEGTRQETHRCSRLPRRALPRREYIMKTRIRPKLDAVVGTGEFEAILEAAGLSSARANTCISNCRPSTSSPAPRPPKSAPAKNPAPPPTSKRRLRRGGGFNPAQWPLTQGEARRFGEDRPEGMGFSPYIEKADKGEPGFRPLRRYSHATRSDPKAICCMNSKGRFNRDTWQGAAHLLPTYLYDEATPALPNHPTLLSLYKDRRRLRPSLHLLRHPREPARQMLLFPPLRIRNC